MILRNYLTGVGFDRSFVMTPNFDFYTEKTQTVEELIYKLGHKLSELEDNDGEVIISDREYDIDKSIIFISGVINYSHEDSLGDYFTPSSSKRNLYTLILKLTFILMKMMKKVDS